MEHLRINAVSLGQFVICREKDLVSQKSLIACFILINTQLLLHQGGWFDSLLKEICRKTVDCAA